MSLVANIEQAKAWDGPEGDHWTEHADGYDRTISRHRGRLLAAGLFSPTDAVLDVGCGTGALTRAAARRVPDGSALGIDLSARMIERARQVADAEGLTNAWFEQADAQVHPFPAGTFDAVVSSFGVMFFGDPERAFANLAQALRPGGGMGLLVWRELARNEWVWALRNALAAGRSLPEPPPGAPGPFGLAEADRIRDLLRGAGMDDVELDPVEEVVDYGTDADEAYQFISRMGIVRGLTKDLDLADRDRALAALRATVAAAATDRGVLFGSSAWLVTARRG